MQLHAHNMVFDALLAWGWVGTACLGFLIACYWMRGLRQSRASDVPEQTPAFLLVSAMLIYAMVDGVYFTITR